MRQPHRQPQARSPRGGLAALLVGAALVLPAAAHARPLYFETFVAHYGLSEGDDLHACGVCHEKWEGTGVRNDYGFAVEQQLYAAKPILTALIDLEGIDTDGDGTSNGDEILGGTLPGYSCANFFEASDPPANFQSLITPGVLSCLDPHGIRVDPEFIPFITVVGKPDTVPVTVFNHGSDEVLVVSSYGLLPGADPALDVSGPAFPIHIPVGGSAQLDVTYAPLAVGGTNSTLRISSDAPDRPTVDVAITTLALVQPLAPADERAGCFQSAQRELQRYTKKHLQEWERCYLAELSGTACDAGRRDQKVAKAAARFHDRIGGVKDALCAGKGLAPVLMGIPTTCGAPCESIPVTSIAGWASCLVCQQDAATSSHLAATAGTTPPDLPSNVLGAAAHSCNQRVVRATNKALRQMQKEFGACALDNVTAASPADCAQALAPKIATLAAKADGTVDRCASVAGMDGCRFAAIPDPLCLGEAARDAADRLTGAVFGAE